MQNHLALCLFAAFTVCRIYPAATGHAAENATAGKGFPLGNPPASASYGKAAAPVQTAINPLNAYAPPAAAATADSAAPVNRTSPNPGPPAVSGADFENHPLAFPDNSRRRRPDGERTGAPSMWTALFAVLVVSSIFGVILYMVKKYLPGHRQLFNHPAMEVLGRTYLDQRRFVSLVRIGKRIVVVGVSPDEMRPLSEITDETEISDILELARPKTEAGLTVFQRLFQKTVQREEAAENRILADVKAAEIDAQMSTLRERMKQIREPDKPPGGVGGGGRRIDALG